MQRVTIVLDETVVRELSLPNRQFWIEPDQTFRNLSPSATEHSIRVRVTDRAEFKSVLPDGMKTVTFTIPPATP